MSFAPSLKTNAITRSLFLSKSPIIFFLYILLPTLYLFQVLLSLSLQMCSFTFTFAFNVFVLLTLSLSMCFYIVLADPFGERLGHNLFVNFFNFLYIFLVFVYTFHQKNLHNFFFTFFTFPSSVLMFLTYCPFSN